MSEVCSWMLLRWAARGVLAQSPAWWSQRQDNVPKQVLVQVRNDARVVVVAAHRPRLTTPSLPVRKYRAIVAVDRLGYQGKGEVLIHLRLA